ncbi:MAG: HAD family hydrolase [Chloroflexi bacterium]|nr:HAD family hydrolase [Chloroflexota bacterium]
MSTVASPSLVFLLDVDNTLLDNDRLKEDLQRTIEERIGQERARRFWEVYEDVRQDEDFVDYPETVRRMVVEYRDPGLGEQLQAILDAVPFTSYLYPHVMEAIAHLNTMGTAVILSDGDSVFQPQKIKKSGLEAAVEGRVLIFVHKELELPTVFERYPADHYVVVDDKARIIAALERECPTRFTTVLVLQGKYAHPEDFDPKPDLVVPHVGDLRTFPKDRFLAGSHDRVPG